MTYNVFGGTLSLTQSINLYLIQGDDDDDVLGRQPVNLIQGKG